MNAHHPAPAGVHLIADKLTPHEKIDALVASIDLAAFEPVIRKAADDFYERLLDSVQNYLRDNTDYNLRADIDFARAGERHSAKQLHEISDALGVGQYSQEARLGRIQALIERASQEAQK